MLCATLGFALVLAAAQAPTENPVYEELLQKGVLMSNGTRTRLPAPTVREGQDAAAQRAAIAQLLAGTKFTYNDLVQKDFLAPFILNIRTLKQPDEKSKFAVRSIDLWFVAHGDWKTATSQEFLEGLWRSAKAQASDPTASKSVTLTEADLAKRKLQPQKGLEERWVFSSLNLFDQVQVSATQESVLNRRLDSVLIAQKIDPRFVKDPEFPDQWRPITTSAGGKVELGPPQPNTAAGSYGKAGPLAAPAGAILFEFHMVFEEPEAWFGGVNLIRSKLPLAVQDQIRTFRRKLAAAGK